MRTTEQLIRIAVGTPRVSVDPARIHDPTGTFDVYRVRLPLPSFQGFPPDWTFAVLNRGAVERGPGFPQNVLASARSIMRNIPDTERLALLSDEPAVSLGDEFRLMDRLVITMDATELPTRETFESAPRLAPLVLALQSKPLSTRAVIELTPYQRGRPVSGWRFFGRRREITELTTSNENFAIVGARRTGKTSLLQEVERQLREREEEVYYVDVQDYRTSNEVAGAILQKIDPRERASALRRSHQLNEKVLPIVLRRMSTSSGRTTLLLDELGNVIRSQEAEDWSFLGTLRKFTQHGHLRIIFTCFQELFLRQDASFSGPLVNMVHTMRLNLFSESEVRDFVFSTLKFWRPVDERTERSLMEVVLSNVGRHPLFLQYFCRALFECAVTQKDHGLVQLAQAIVRQDLLTVFEPAVEEVFYRINSPMLQYLFLRRCREADVDNQELRTTVLDDDWLEDVFESLGERTALSDRRRFLEALEVRGLCAPYEHDRRRQVIAVPLIYRYVKRVETSVDRLLQKLEREARAELASSELLASRLPQGRGE